ncbi:hypothetical protein V9W64_04715 [Neisseria leonii]|uniref:Uncharacterized protein n=1 Tax=Neisseria leonii TaxID=2995413 RepID=A0A9X4E307_9NEIS|nr:hypothetical protein [Neisseria sp. 51.81]MDD9328518.1 hypothetical protein [Neisseria sp. 51.81]
MNTSRPKPAFRLTPKKLLLAVFLLAVSAVAALVVGVFRTLNQTSAAAAAPADNNTAVEIWSPGRSSAVGTLPAGQAVPPLPANDEVQTADNTAGNTESAESAAAPNPAATVKAARSEPAAPAVKTETVKEAAVKAETPQETVPGPVAAKPDAPKETPAKPVAAKTEAPKEAAPKPAAKPKDLTDNLF